MSERQTLLDNHRGSIVTGGPFNWGHYTNAEVDRLMNQARSVPTVEERRALYEQVMRVVQRDRPLIYLWHPRLFMAHTTRLTGFTAVASSHVTGKLDLSRDVLSDLVEMSPSIHRLTREGTAWRDRLPASLVATLSVRATLFRKR